MYKRQAVYSEGDEVEVKLIGFDRGKMKLSVKALQEKKVAESANDAEEASDSEE